MRLDIFLPFLRKAKKGTAPQPDNLALRGAKRLLPGSLFADKTTGKPGRMRRWFKRLGPTVLSSPLRRLSQAVCFVAFLVLFFFVCWPYTAKPAPPTLLSDGWTTAESDLNTGRIRIAREKIAASAPAAKNAVVHLIDSDIISATDGYLAAFRVTHADATSIELSPLEPLMDEQLDRLVDASGRWSLHRDHPWPRHYADDLAAKEFVDAEAFLVIDPLVAISTAVAARSWVWSLTCGAVILLVCVFIPRGFCGYICPLGTLIDLFDWAVAGRVRRFRVPDDGWWVHIKYYLLLGVMVCAVMGVLVSGFFAAIPVITRGLLFIFEPLQNGLLRDWHQVPPLNAGQVFSIALFVAVLSLGFLRPRFWCKYVCPSGAVFSLGNLFRVSERKVESTCINCNKCVEICPFDAIKPDFTTRVTDCTLCQTCGGVCPTQAIKFVERWNTVELKIENDPPTQETALGRRGFLSLAAGTAAAIVGGAATAIAHKSLGSDQASPPVRPPGSVPEPEFLDLCIRCGECFKACPNNVLQAAGFEHGLEGLWAPYVAADWAGCESSCNACGQVCPTGAIRALPLAEKRVARMGLAIVNQNTCLPVAGREACQWCVDECVSAGYHAIEQLRVGTEVDEQGNPIEGTGQLAPVVIADKCVGCGLCQTRCFVINVKDKDLLSASAIVIEAGDGKEDRLMNGSYVELRQQEAKTRREAERTRNNNQDKTEYLIPSTDSGSGPADPLPEKLDPADPFGLGQ